MKKLVGFLVGISICAVAWGQAGPIKGEVSAGVYANVKVDSNGNIYTTPANAATVADPCASTAVVKNSAIVSITSAATTQLIALSGTTTIYVCAVTLSISQVATTANTLKFVYGTGTNCGTGTTNLSGLFGDGGVTAGVPIVIAAGTGAGIFKTASANALCATTTIGASGSFQGTVSYVQQ